MTPQMAVQLSIEERREQIRRALIGVSDETVQRATLEAEWWLLSVIAGRVPGAAGFALAQLSKLEKEHPESMLSSQEAQFPLTDEGLRAARERLFGAPSADAAHNAGLASRLDERSYPGVVAALKEKEQQKNEQVKK